MIEIINPYNFIPFKDKPDRGSIAETYALQKELVSGWMEITLTPKTDLIIPSHKAIMLDENGALQENVSQKDLDRNNRHPAYRFYRNPDNEYAIPGSSIRGMIRSVYEAASNSCLPFLRDNGTEPFSMRTPVRAAWKNRALLGKNTNGKWTLYSIETPVSQISVTDRRAFTSEGEWIDGRNQKWNVGDRMQVNGKTGWIQFQNPVVLHSRQPYHISILVQDVGKPDLFSWEDDCAYKALLDAAEESLKNDGSNGNASTYSKKIHEKWVECLKAAGKDFSRRVPVWYQIIKTDGISKCYLSLSSIGRVPMNNTWEEIAGAYAPCRDADQLCPACQLFGTVNAGGYKGRLKFTDATPVDQNNLYFYWRTLAILGGPKPSAYEFYLKKPASGTRFWNYDYFVTGSQNFAAYHGYRPVMNGRKMYWHHVPEDINESEHGSMNATMQVLRAGETAKFRMKLFFDRITEQQLKQLQWTVSLGGDGRHFHKLGRGRPLGYGSVELTIEKTVFRTIRKDDSGVMEYLLNSVEENTSQKCIWDTGSDPVRSILAMTEWKKTDVDYPRGNDGNIFTWFSGNRNRGNLQTLPAPTDRKLTISSFEKDPIPEDEEFHPTKDILEREYQKEGKAYPPVKGGKATAEIVRITEKGKQAGKSGKCVFINGDIGYFTAGGRLLTDDFHLAPGDKIIVSVIDYDEERKQWVAQYPADEF